MDLGKPMTGLELVSALAEKDLCHGTHLPLRKSSAASRATEGLYVVIEVSYSFVIKRVNYIRLQSCTCARW